MVQECAKSDWICMILRASLQLSLSLWLEHVSAFLSTLPFVGLPPIVRQDAKENQSLLVQWLSGKKHLPTFVQKVSPCSSSLPCHIATSSTSSHPHIHPQATRFFLGLTQRSLRLQNHSPSQGSHEENPKMIGLLQINITRCHSLPPDQLCLVIETSRFVLFSHHLFFGYFFSITTFQRTTWLGVFPSMMIELFKDVWDFSRPGCSSSAKRARRGISTHLFGRSKVVKRSKWE